MRWEEGAGCERDDGWEGGDEKCYYYLYHRQEDYDDSDERVMMVTKMMAEWMRIAHKA